MFINQLSNMQIKKLITLIMRVNHENKKGRKKFIQIFRAMALVTLQF